LAFGARRQTELAAARRERARDAISGSIVRSAGMYLPLDESVTVAHSQHCGTKLHFLNERVQLMCTRENAFGFSGIQAGLFFVNFIRKFKSKPKRDDASALLRQRKSPLTA